jgi:glucose/arabinose dehydrogenase
MTHTRIIRIVALTLAAPALAAGQGVQTQAPNAPDQRPAFAGQTRAPEQRLNVAFDVVTVAEGFQNPWSIAFLPGGKMLVTERPGRLRVVSADGKMSEPVTGFPDTLPQGQQGQGGYLDVAVDPEFASSGLIYLCYSEPREGGANNTAVARGKLVDGAAPRVDGMQVIYHQAPSLNSRLHFGCRLVFGRDGALFVTQGDRSITEGRMQAQNMDSLIGKIVRINRDGTIPKDNPFVGMPAKDTVRPEIWARGVRNVQAATLHPTTGELWEIEHGTRGGDEINVVRKGLDYGWPTIAYGIEYRGGPITGNITAKDGLEQPIYYWDPVIGPSGMAFYTGNLFPAWKGSLFIGGHQTTDLVRLSLGTRTVTTLGKTVEEPVVTGEERLLTDLQPKRERLRDVRQGPDGSLYILTDSAQGRLLKLVPAK